MERSQPDPWADGRLTSAQLDGLLRGMAGLAVLPSVARAVLEAVARPGSGPGPPEHLVAIVRNDPALTARVLTLAASLSPSAATAEAAMQRLGGESITGSLLALPIAPPAEDDEGQPISLRQLYRHSLAVALAARMLAEQRGGVDPVEAFTCGLLHDLGKLALACALPKSFHRAAELAVASRTDISDPIQRVIGADDTTVGRRLAEMWRLPAAVGEVAWLHDQPPHTLPAAVAGETIELVALADALVCQARLGFSGDFLPAPSIDERAARLNLTREPLDEVRRQLPQALKACELPPPLGHEATDHLLGQLVAVLAATNRTLHAQAAANVAQANAFRQLHQFAAVLHGESSVAETLRQVAELIAAAAGLTPSRDKPVLAYAVPPPGQAVEVVRHDGGEALACRALKAAPSPPPEPPAGAGEVLAALLDEPTAMGDWSVPPDSRHMPLVCGGRWAGGVLLPVGGASEGRGVLAAVTDAAAMALAMVQGKSRAMVLSEQLAAAAKLLADEQQNLAEAQTLSAIGELAAGAAHELNNPLAVISGRAQLMRDKADSDEHRKTWSLITEQAQRISDTLTALMEIATPPPPQPTRLDAGELLKSAAEAFSSSAHPQAAATQVDINIGEGTPAAWADAAQVRWVIVEAITNAATAAGGPAHIRLTARPGDDGHTVLLTVSDDGPGMEATTLERAFTPFFSSQRAGRRQGLGLPKARRYVENNVGKIWIASQPGQGTQLHIQLPQA